LAAQQPILKRLGFSADAQGLSELECAVVNCAKNSEPVLEKLKQVRIALHGGANGMWAINVEQDEPQWSDTNSMQLRADFTKSDPFGPGRINTNAVPVS